MAVIVITLLVQPLAFDADWGTDLLLLVDGGFVVARIMHDCLVRWDLGLPFLQLKQVIAGCVQIVTSGTLTLLICLRPVETSFSHSSSYFR